jgi:hypothetical protein
MDRLFYVNAALFSDHFKTLYHDFINLYFIPGPLNEYDASAKMRTDIKIRKQLVTKSGNIWDPAWDALFSQAGEIACREDVVRSYSNLMDAFAAELGVELK